MTWKDELLMLWILCTVIVTLAAHHFFSGALYLVEHVAAFSVPYLPRLLHMLQGFLR
jgi:hypothetical protein